MPCPLFAAVGAAMGATAGTAAATTLGATTVLSVGGSVLSSVGQAWMAKKEADDQEKAIIAAEKRRQDAYKGVGSAVDFAERDKDPNKMVSEEIADAAPVGERYQAPQRIGDIYKQRAAQKRQARTPRIQYNRDTRQIEQY